MLRNYLRDDPSLPNCELGPQFETHRIEFIERILQALHQISKLSGCLCKVLISSSDKFLDLAREPLKPTLQGDQRLREFLINALKPLGCDSQAFDQATSGSVRGIELLGDARNLIDRPTDDLGDLVQWLNRSPRSLSREFHFSCSRSERGYSLLRRTL